MPKLAQYEVIVVGGGTAGCAAAYIAGKSGLRTLLVEKNIHLGGTMTSGLVIPAMNSSQNQINTDFYKALIKELKPLNGQATYMNNPGWFNPELCKIALDRLMAKANVEVLFDTHIVGVNTLNKEIDGLMLSSNMLSVYIGAKYVVDATGNCDVAKLAGAEFIQNENEFQPVSLRFEMSGINLNTFSSWLLDYDKDRTVTTMQLIDGQIHLSTAYTWDTRPKDKIKWALEPLFLDAVKEKVLKDSDRSYFQLFTIPNMLSSVAFNCPRVYLDTDVNPLDNSDISKALIEGREAIVRIANFCKAYFPGFEKSYISNIADMLGVRVSRRIKGKYVYTINDLKTGKKFENPVLISNYPIDIHSNKKGESVLEHSVVEYQLPMESLMSADFRNLFVAGRCLSADFHAHAALRIQPSCFSMGEGIAKWIKMNHCK
mgnify:CR=1 FL=1